MSDDRTDEGMFRVDASGGDVELPPVLVGVTDRESDALERVHLLLYAQRRHKLADAIGHLLDRVPERQQDVMTPAVIHEGVMPTDETDQPEDELRPDPWAEDWET